MAMYVNLISAWVTVVLAVLCTVIWGLRLVHKRWYPGQKNVLYRINRTLRRPHKWLGITMVITAAIHGLLSSDALIGWNLGTMCWILCILTGFTYLARKKLSNPSWIVWHRIAAAVMICVLAVHIIHTGIQIDDLLWADSDAQAENIDLSEIIDDYNQTVGVDAMEDTEDTEKTAAAVWEDGVYVGEGTGFRPGLKVQVTIEAGAITAIEVIEHNEHKEKYWGKPVTLIPQRIIDAQSTDVDTVTGATMTSRGIIEAVEDALEQASVDA